MLLTLEVVSLFTRYINSIRVNKQNLFRIVYHSMCLIKSKINFDFTEIDVGQLNDKEDLPSSSTNYYNPMMIFR